MGLHLIKPKLKVSKRFLVQQTVMKILSNQRVYSMYKLKVLVEKRVGFKVRYDYLFSNLSSLPVLIDCESNEVCLK